MPRFSVLVPTRDRPDLLGFCLEGLAQQRFLDVEVVVADNPVELPAREVFERWRRDGWRYVRAPEPLTMHDNWEFGLQHTTGELVSVAIDKTILQPSALELANRALEDDPEADLVSWWNDGYNPDDEAGELGDGILIPTPETREPERFDAAAELR
jgi:glycosyltransferase involved in cell wall biosynthesis